MHNHGAAARIGVIPRFLQSSVWDATDVKRLTCLPSRALEGRRGRQTIDSSAVPQILGCVRLPAAYSGCRSPPPPIAPHRSPPCLAEIRNSTFCRHHGGMATADSRRDPHDASTAIAHTHHSYQPQISRGRKSMRQAASESDLGKPQTLQMALLQGYMPVQTPLIELIEQIEQPA